MKTAAWSAVVVLALLWPAHVLGSFDGIPLTGRAEALLIGVAVPALWWLDRSAVHTRSIRALAVALLAVRIGGSFLVQEGWCARFATTAPLEGVIQTIPIGEPNGVLRSWDVRADWRAESPRCTAIVDRPYESAAEFPSWFVNILDHLNRGPRHITMTVEGAMTVRDAGAFRLATGEDMQVRARIGSADVTVDSGRSIDVPLEAGTHALRVDAVLTGERWRFVPSWNGEPAFRSAYLTLSPPGRAAPALAFLVRWISTLLAIAIVIAWSLAAFRRAGLNAPAIAWIAAASIALAAMAAGGRFERAASALLIASAAVPVTTRWRNVRGAFLLVGVPWLAFWCARAVPLVGRVTAYSADDWLTYQVASARIFMHGYWLEGGNRTFDYQPLYRWIAGLLHLVYGDSSVGETLLDAACLLAGALTAFVVARRFAGFRWGLVAAAGTLATFTAGTIWYFIGRGLSEIAAAGFAFAAVLALLRARLGSVRWAFAGGLAALLMFYTRLNHLLFAGVLVAALLPTFVSADVRAIAAGLRRIRLRAAGIYAATFALGVALFATRTWWYTGVFGLFYGTSLKNNDTGLRLGTIASAEPWRNVAHSLSALVWMNEPPHPDPRSILVVGGTLAALGALCQLPGLRRLPALLVAITLGALISSFFAHTHNYPGRMSIHLVPFAACTLICALSLMARFADA